MLAANPMQLVGRPKLAKALPKALPRTAVEALLETVARDRDSKRQTGQSGSDIDGPPSEGESEHMRALRLLAAAMMQRDPALSKQQAMAKTILTPDGAKLYLLDRQARFRAA